MGWIRVNDEESPGGATPGEVWVPTERQREAIAWRGELLRKVEAHKAEALYLLAAWVMSILKVFGKRKR